MPNPNPKTDQLKDFLFVPVGEVQSKLSRKALQFVVEEEIHDFLMTLPREQRIPLLRKWVQDGAKALMEAQTTELTPAPKQASKRRR